VELRPYQLETERRIFGSWYLGAKNIVAVLPTGAGKTVLLSSIIKKQDLPVCVIAHRQELITQLSGTLTKHQIKHQIIGSDSVTRISVKLQMEEHGYSLVDPNASVYVASVKTLVNRSHLLRDWPKRVGLWVIDEAHHVLTTNQWGRAVEMFPNARGLGVTATPERADGQGIDCVFDKLIVGPNMSDLMDLGFLTPYRIYVPESDLDLSGVPITKTGDYSEPKTVAALRKSRIIGDIVGHYKKLAPGKIGATFAPNVETAEEISQGYNDGGVPSAVLSGKTPPMERASIIAALRNRELLQVVNCNVLTEGFDLPAIEVVTMARPTASFPLYSQIFGRGLRTVPGYDKVAIVIDHVGNVIRLGLPDAPRLWDISGKNRKHDPDFIPITTCPICTMAFEKIYKTCPDCGDDSAIKVEAECIKQVDGDLTELGPEAIEVLKGKVKAAFLTPEEKRLDLIGAGAPSIGVSRHVKLHTAVLEERTRLKQTIEQWGQFQRQQGRPDSEAYRRFYHKFGIDVFNAQTQNKVKTIKLIERVQNENRRLGGILENRP